MSGRVPKGSGRRVYATIGLSPEMSEWVRGEALRSGESLSDVVNRLLAVAYGLMVGGVREGQFGE